MKLSVTFGVNNLTEALALATALKNVTLEADDKTYREMLATMLDGVPVVSVSIEGEA